MNLGRRDILKAIAGSVAATFLGGIQIGEEDRERNRLREIRDRLAARFRAGWGMMLTSDAGMRLVWVDAEEVSR